MKEGWLMGAEQLKIAIYARVSTKNGQDPEMQLAELREYIRNRKWKITGEYVDRGISGASDSRPELNRLMADANRRRFDMVAVWKFDRFARSVSHLLGALESFQALGIEFVSLSESVDTSTPAGKMVFTVLGAVAELERSLIVERIRSGMKNARAKGHNPGPKAFKLDLDEIRTRITVGESRRSVARSLGISASLLTKRLKAHQKQQGPI